MSKEERREPHLHMFSEGRVLIKNKQPWTTELANEWLRFPFGKHDDGGTDEIGRMAEALAVFRSTAIEMEDSAARRDGCPLALLRQSLPTHSALIPTNVLSFPKILSDMDSHCKAESSHY